MHSDIFRSCSFPIHLSSTCLFFPLRPFPLASWVESRGPFMFCLNSPVRMRSQGSHSRVCYACYDDPTRYSCDGVALTPLVFSFTYFLVFADTSLLFAIFHCQPHFSMRCKRLRATFFAQGARFLLRGKYDESFLARFSPQWVVPCGCPRAQSSYLVPPRFLAWCAPHLDQEKWIFL